MSIGIGVALPADGETAHVLIERASSLAERLNSRWAAFVICNDAISSARAAAALRQAHRAMLSGGTVFFCEGDVAKTLLALAARERIDVLLIGAPRRSGLLRRFRLGTVDRLLRAQRSFDVVVVPTGPRP